MDVSNTLYVLLFTYLKYWPYYSGSWDSLDESYPKEYNEMVIGYG
jgi:hypothetical protein